MMELSIFLLIVLIAYGLGKPVLNLLKINGTTVTEEFVFSTAIGLGVLAYSIYAIGSVSFLYKNVIIGLLLLSGIIAVPFLYNLASRVKWFEAIHSLKALSAFDIFLLVVIIVIAVACLFGASAPEVGNDALAYHLYHPKIFIENHKIGYIPFTRESLWPYLTEMLFTIGLILKSVTIAKLFNYLFGVLSVAAVYSFTKRFFSKREALLASALFYSAPGILMQSVYSYVDLSLSFYSFLALYAFVLAINNKDRTKLILLSGIFTGLALSVKLLGGITLISICALTIIFSVRKKEKPAALFKEILLFLAVSFFICCVWYIRSYLVLKNPVYPFLHNLFNSGWHSELGEVMGYRKGFIGFLRLPWDLVMHLDSFGSEQIGIISLAFLPLLLFLPFKKIAVSVSIIFMLLYAIIWFYVDPNIRFAFVSFAIIYMLISAGFYNFMQKYRFGMVRVILLLCLLFNMSLALYYNRDAIRLAAGTMDREKYLYMNERTYPVAKFVNENLPKDSVLVSVGEPRIFYFDRDVLQYDVVKNTKGENSRSYIDNLKKEGMPLYLLHRSDVNFAEILPIIEGEKPAYEVKREIGENQSAYYRLYKL